MRVLRENLNIATPRPPRSEVSAVSSAVSSRHCSETSPRHSRGKHEERLATGRQARALRLPVALRCPERKVERPHSLLFESKIEHLGDKHRPSVRRTPVVFLPPLHVREVLRRRAPKAPLRDPVRADLEPVQHGDGGRCATSTATACAAQGS